MLRTPIGTPCRPQPSIRDDAPASAGAHVHHHEPTGDGEYLAELLIIECRDGRERIDAGQKARLRLVDVADACDRPLIEQRFTERHIVTVPEAAKGVGLVEGVVEQIGSERIERARPGQCSLCEELGDGDLKRDGDKRVGLDHDAHAGSWTLPSFPGPVHVPRTVHPHVRPQGEAARKTDQKMLALCPDTIHGSAGERCVSIDAREGREDRIEPRDDASGEREIERSGRAEYRVAFWHYDDLTDYRLEPFEPTKRAEA